MIAEDFNLITLGGSTNWQIKDQPVQFSFKKTETRSITLLKVVEVGNLAQYESSVFNS